MPTRVNKAKLKEWKEQLPQRLHTFLENFFRTCEAYDPEVNYLNYLRDVESYARTTRAYREHRAQLQEAFHEIAGWRPQSEESDHYPTCPSCQSEEFSVEGLVGYTQFYNSRTEDYGGSEIEWDIDFRQRVRCWRCEHDMTDAFMGYNIFLIYGDPPLK